MELVSGLLVVSVTGGTSHTYLLTARPEELVEGLGQLEFPESSTPVQAQSTGMVSVCKELMCEGWGQPGPRCLYQPCRKLPVPLSSLRNGLGTQQSYPAFPSSHPQGYRIVGLGT